MSAEDTLKAGVAGLATAVAFLFNLLWSGAKKRAELAETRAEKTEAELREARKTWDEERRQLTRENYENLRLLHGLHKKYVKQCDGGSTPPSS